jgi:hypothetical protein
MPTEDEYRSELDREAVEHARHHKTWPAPGTTRRVPITNAPSHLKDVKPFPHTGQDMTTHSPSIQDQRLPHALARQRIHESDDGVVTVDE